MAAEGRHVVIGTAGHVDHGKTTLTKALTGVDTDRLKEEKERALSIDLGFAPLTLPSGQEASIVDVPGHERFIKNMVAGVTGMDVVVLVVAADEGVMPQTREHVDIVSLLDVKSGLVALTKIDTVDTEWAEMALGEVSAVLVGTPFEGAPIVPCSGVTGEGLDELLARLDDLARQAAERDLRAPFFAAIDRVFVIKGFGTVVTGTVSRGRLRAGDEVEILPAGRRCRVRSVQVHGAEAPVAMAGHRAALNLHGITAEEVERGDVLAEPGSLHPTSMLDVAVRVIGHSRVSLEYWDRVRVHLGTSEVIARVVLLGDAEALRPGESGFVQLRLESPTAAPAGTHCVLRTYSPAYTFAGGPIIDANPPKHRGQRRRAAAEELEARRHGSADELLDRAVRAIQGAFGLAELIAAAGLPETEETVDLVDARLADGRLARLQGGLLASGEALASATEQMRGAVASYHERLPLRPGVDRGELRRQLGETPVALAREALQRLIGSGEVVAIDSERVRLADHRASLSEAQARAADGILAEARAEGVTGIDPAAVERAAGHPDAAEIIAHLVEEGSLARVGERLLHAEELAAAREVLRGLLASSGTVKVGAFRDALGSSRKAVVPLLEHFDREGITRRQGDDRVAGPHA